MFENRLYCENLLIQYPRRVSNTLYATANVVEYAEKGGSRALIDQFAEAFDVEIPEINAVYTHMLGHDCHSIAAGAGRADGMIAQLKAYIKKGYDLILTSHYTPEGLKDAQTKIDYLERLKAIASACRDAGAFKAEEEGVSRLRR